MFSSDQELVTPLSLEGVSANFAQWRATRIKKSRIPEALWQQVGLLLNKYPVGKVSKTLHLSGSQIKAKMQCTTNIEKVHCKPPTFVPIDIQQVNQEPDVGKIEIKRADGAVLSIDRLNQATLTHLLTQFMKGV